MDDFEYLERMFQAGLNNYMDGIGAHPSGYNVPPQFTWEQGCEAIRKHGNSFNGACDNPHHSWSFRSTMEGYRNIAVKYGAGNKLIWPTEFGWAAGGAFDPRYGYAQRQLLRGTGSVDGRGLPDDERMGLGRPGHFVESEFPRCGQRHGKGAVGYCGSELGQSANLQCPAGYAEVAC